MKVGTELRGIRDGIFAPMDTNLTPSASTGEPKVFYCKLKGDYYRFLAEFPTGDAKSKVAGDVVDVPAVLQRQVPMSQRVRKTVEVPQVQYIGEIVDEPVVMQGQVSTTQTVQKTVEVSQVQFPDRVADVLVVSQRHVPGPLIQEEIVEVTPLPRVCDEIAELNDDHKKYYERFVQCMKLGIHENSVDDF